MMYATVVGGVTRINVLKTKGERDFLEIQLASDNVSGISTFWKCHSYFPSHLKLVSTLYVGQQLIICGELTRIEAYLTKDGEPAACPVLRINDIAFVRPAPRGHEP